MSHKTHNIPIRLLWFKMTLFGWWPSILDHYDERDRLFWCFYTVPFRPYSSVNQSNNFLLLAFSQNKSPRGGFEFERIKLRTLCHYRPCSYFQIFLTRGINWWDFISQFVTKNKGMRWLNFKFCMCVLVTVEVSKVVTCKLFCSENIFLIFSFNSMKNHLQMIFFLF